MPRITTMWRASWTRIVIVVLQSIDIRRQTLFNRLPGRSV
ncbi:hypothetical protein TOK_5496 [Pseudonocardia sp. N23]|nr:hypothetical protein TOK_5496 [Pseudonocardia sp. N23]